MSKFEDLRDLIQETRRMKARISHFLDQIDAAKKELKAKIVEVDREFLLIHDWKHSEGGWTRDGKTFYSRRQAIHHEVNGENGPKSD